MDAVSMPLPRALMYSIPTYRSVTHTHVKDKKPAEIAWEKNWTQKDEM